jgi:hypothetical protein
MAMPCPYQGSSNVRTAIYSTELRNATCKRPTTKRQPKRLARQKKEIPPLYEFSNQLGEEGWEVVGLNYTPCYGYGFLFRHPKELL